MSAAEIIEQIKTLPENERAQVIAFLHEEESRASESGHRDEVKAAGEWVVQKYAPLLKEPAK
jgi:hypothetical protein